jgi:hypothetical protein
MDMVKILLGQYMKGLNFYHNYVPRS